MKQNEIKILLEKYFEAETSLKEEQILREFFQNEKIDPELEPYKAFFTEMPSLSEETESSEFEKSIMEHILKHEAESKSRYRSIWLKITGIAASLLIAMGGFLYHQNQQNVITDSFSNPEEALAYAQETLNFISEKYNMGMAHLQPVQMLNHAVQPLESSLQTIQKGLETINYTEIITE